MSIKESVNKIKGNISTVSADTKHNLFMVLLIVLVGTASFGLGRLSTDGSGGDEGIQIIMPNDLSASAINSVVAGEGRVESGESAIPDTVYVPDKGGEVVASKSGTKYHFPWCAGAKQIAEKNLITFASIEEARKAGYTPAANCKGLK